MFFDLMIINFYALNDYYKTINYIFENKLTKHTFYIKINLD